jgi:glycosyltransferase involved in cell wall biosynthesis
MINVEQMRRQNSGNAEERGNCQAVSAVVPVYNSEKNLEILVTRLSQALDRCSSENEIILVNDGSHDGSWETIERLARSNPRLCGIDLMRNYGQHNALLAGIRAARYEFIVTLDDDLQNPPEEIPKLLEQLALGYDVVYGTPETERHGLWRDLASQTTKMALASVVGARNARNASAFRAFRSEIRHAFDSYCGPRPNIDVLLGWGSRRFAAIKVKHQERQEGKSNYTFSKLIRHALNMMTGFSTVPLRIASCLGFVFTLFGIAVLVYVVCRYAISGSPVQGFPFLASIIAIFSGVQLFCLGVIGEYIAYIHSRSLDKPAYTLRARTRDMTGANAGPRENLHGNQ